MAVILSNSLFIHIPKTGGTWVCSALERANLIKNKSKWKHPSFHEFRTNDKIKTKKVPKKRETTF